MHFYINSVFKSSWDIHIYELESVGNGKTSVLETEKLEIHICELESITEIGQLEKTLDLQHHLQLSHIAS